MRDLCGDAVDAAVAAGASYADARGRLSALAVGRDEERERRVGQRRRDRGDRRPRPRRRRLGLRRRPAADRRGRARRRASRLRVRARGGRPGGRHLAPIEPQSGSFKARVEIDPFSVSLDEKIDFCLEAERALARPEVKVAEAYGARPARAQGARLVGGHRGRAGDRRVRRRDRRDRRRRRNVTQMRSYPSAHGGISAQAGWEFVARPRARATRRRASASRRPRCCTAPECPAGVMDVVIDAEQMQLQVHESVGHPTELDRVLGFEAAYAGTSFLQPGDRRLASLRLRAHERHRRPDDAERARHVRLRRRGRAGAARSRSCARACSSAGSARARSASPARCAPTAGAGCRSCA